jgi:hypothetical protein
MHMHQKLPLSPFHIPKFNSGIQTNPILPRPDPTQSPTTNTKTNNILRHQTKLTSINPSPETDRRPTSSTRSPSLYVLPHIVSHGHALTLHWLTFHKTGLICGKRLLPSLPVCCGRTTFKNLPPLCKRAGFLRMQGRTCWRRWRSRRCRLRWGCL